jgi:dTDP-4-dehydrorhamnose reductase
VSTTLLTGRSGTLGPVLADALRAGGDTCLGWDRVAVPPDDLGAARALLDREDPARVVHLAFGAEAWAATLAGWCRERGRPFLFVSTAMVFDRVPDGPHRPEDARTGQDENGRYKARCEDAVRDANPDALIARIGWQIGERRGGNHMLEALHGMVERDGCVRASRRWVPATSFLVDTCAALQRLLDARAPGTFHVDGNAECAWTFDRIARALVARHGLDWRIEETDEYVHDQRLVDPRVLVASIAARLAQA